MSRAEWALVTALMLVTILTLSFSPPGPAQTPPEAVAPSSTATITARPTSRATSTPTPTETPSRTATSTPTRRPSATSTLGATSCPTSSPTTTPTPFPFDPRPDLARYIYVDQAAQHVYVFERGGLVRDIPCSTGLPDADNYTPAWSGEVGEYWGTFFAYGVYVDEAWYLFKSEGSILVHSLPYTMVKGSKVYDGGETLGVQPASHGCIRIAPLDAAWFTTWGPEGVPLTIGDPCLGKQP